MGSLWTPGLRSFWRSISFFPYLPPFHGQGDLDALGLELLSQMVSLGFAIAVLKPAFEFFNLTHKLHFTGPDACVLENRKRHPVLARRAEISRQVQGPAFSGKILKLP